MDKCILFYGFTCYMHGYDCGKISSKLPNSPLPAFLDISEYAEEISGDVCSQNPCIKYCWRSFVVNTRSKLSKRYNTGNASFTIFDQFV